MFNILQVDIKYAVGLFRVDIHLSVLGTNNNNNTGDDNDNDDDGKKFT